MAYLVIRGKLVKVHKNRWTGRSNVQQVIQEEAKRTEKAELKGKKDGNCNVTACQVPGATWWNTGTRAYYCRYCSSEINKWARHDLGHNLCFESKEAADAFEAAR